MAEAQIVCRRIQDSPSSEINPITFVAVIKKLFKPFEKKVTMKVLNKKDIE